MKTVLLLCLSVVKRNKVFTVGLFLLYTVLTAISVMTQATLVSVSGTADDFIVDCSAPDIWAVTSLIPVSEGESTADISGVADCEQELTFDIRCRIKNEEVFVLRLYTVSDDGFRKFSRISESKDNKNSLPEIWMTAFFADSNGIVPGDTVELMMPDGYKDFFVSAIVSSPESMMCSRDSYSWCDFGDFGFVYLDREEADKLFGTEGLSNVNYYKLDSDVSDERKDEIFKEISSAFGGSLVTSEKFETSEAKKTMDDELTQMSKVIRYLPAVVFAMGLFFSFLFISQVIRNQRKTIGLLRGIGYSGKRVLLIFATYCVGVCLSGMIAGSGLGALLTKYCVSIYQKRYSLPYIHYDIKVWGFALMMFGIVAVSLFSCVLQSNTISSVNPAEAYGGSSPAATSELPNWIKKLKLESLTKMTVISIYRNKKRFFMSVFSIAACLVLTLNCIALNTSNNAAMPAAFGGRFCYDLLVKHQDGIFASSLEEIPGVSEAETITVFEDTLYFGDSSLEAQIQAIPENSKLIRPKDASGKLLSAGDGIILEEISAKLLGASVGDTVTIKDVPLKVTGISREIVNAIQYISPETAVKLGYSKPNMTAIKYDENADVNEVHNRITEIKTYEYTINAEHQKQALSDSCDAVNAVLYVFIILAFVLGIIIIYIMVVINIGEKKGEYSMLMALGIQTKRFIKIAAVENVIRYIFSVLIGVPLGLLIASFVLGGMSSVRTSYPLVNVTSVCVLSCLFAMLYLIVGVFLTLYVIKRVDPAFTLNTRE